MKNHSFGRVWRAPLLLALITVFGLMSALLGTGSWYVLSWICLLLPLSVIVGKVFFIRSEGSSRD